MKVHRRRFVLTTAVALLATSLGSKAQQPAGMKRIGHLSGSAGAVNKPLLDAFRLGLRERGYVEGQHYAMDERYAEGKLERLPALAKELLDRKPDVLLVATTPANLAIKAAHTVVPVVFVLVADPVGAGIVPSLARQGVNVTGVTPMVAELAGKRLEILKEISPKASRFAVIVNPKDENTPLQMRYAEEGARALGIKLDPILEVRTPGELEGAFAAAAKAKVAGALRMIDPLVFMLRTQTAQLAVKYGIPVVFPLREDVEAGGLVSYGANVADQFKQAAFVTDKILKGASASGIPVEQPTKLDLVINMKTAKEMGLSMPRTLLLRADHLIE